MPKLPFNVLARTAKLIGQENFANAQGAITELVKNSYDADATDCLIIFDNKKNHIYLIDNGEGMTEDIIQNQWMTIGTDNKLTDHKTCEGRVKSGAKGIGRFALDRLGMQTTVFTFPKESSEKIIWKIKWGKFNENININQINAGIRKLSNVTIKDILLKNLSKDSDFFKVKTFIENLENDKWSNGTIIRIENLKDSWNEDSLNDLYKNLEIIRPPIEQKNNFRIYLFSNNYDELGEIKTVAYDEYDYKVVVKYLDNESKDIDVTIIRNELDIKKIENEYFKIFDFNDMKESRYDLDSFKKKSINFIQSIYDLKGYKNVDEKLLNGIGKFDFTYYYIKNTDANQKEKQTYPYKEIKTDIRKKFLNRHVGIKLFRDGFRVRPYGEGGNDWLNLGERQAQSPAGAGQNRNGFRIRPNQISGTINISRIYNLYLQDKSGREGLQENDYFYLFKNIVIDFINIFEKDRNIIMYNISKLKENEEEELIKKAKIEAEKIKREKQEREKQEREKQEREKQEREKQERESQESESQESESQESESQERESQERESQEREGQEREGQEREELLAEATEIYEKQLKLKDDEIRALRSSASVGLTLSSFAHEVKSLRTRLVPRNEYLKKQIEKYINHEELSKISKKEENPLYIVQTNYEEDLKLKHWLDYSLNSMKRDKRERIKVNISQYFEGFENTWKKALERLKIDLKSLGKNDKNFNVKAFEVDLDVIFNNLLSNAIVAFKQRKGKYPKIITIDWMIKGNFIEIIFLDNAVGLSSEYINSPYDIFDLHESSKRDKKGNKIGTGLGLYLVKSIIDQYNNADIEIIKQMEGFGIKIILPLT
ncbi:ATP-binding protein [Aliarcobacter butzleri]|uniref:ATP-binding protein n=1 Tax=Aliarcobacter butzleri TaxID=28197 RepID=UPI00344EE592